MTTALEHVYTPRASATELFYRQDPEILVSGPAGTGKSRACLEKLHLMCLVNPGMTALIVRKTRVSLGSTALKTFREIVAREAIECGLVEYYGGSDEKPPQYRYDNGSAIHIGGMDRPTRVMSSDYDIIYVQEATELTETDWQMLTSRLRNWKVSFQQLIADCNPAQPTHWLKSRCDKGTAVLLESRHEDNPELFDDDGSITERGEQYLARLDSLTGVRYHRLRRGLWVAAEGVIYESWDPAIHLIDRFEIPRDWVRWWSVDFGFTHPFVLQRWAEDPDGRLYLYAEQYHTRKLVEDHARDVLRQVCPGAPEGSDPGTHGTWREPRPRAIICDHDAEDRATLERHLGLSTTKAHKTVSDGIQAVESRLRPAGDGRPRLFCISRRRYPARSGTRRTQAAGVHCRGIRRIRLGGFQDERTAGQGRGRRDGRHALHGR